MSCIAATFFLTALSVFGVGARDLSQAQGYSEELLQAISVFERSRDRNLLESTALDLCASKDPKALEVLTKWLLDPVFVARMDNEEEYKYYRHRLRIKRVLLAIGKKGTAEAESALLRLGEDREFTRHVARMDGLIVACGWIKKPSAKLLEFLDSRITKQGTYTSIVIDALAQMHTPESCALLEKWFHSADYVGPSRPGWFTETILEYRNDPNIVAFYRRLLSVEIRDERLRNRMIQSLYDYRPLDWYGRVGYSHMLRRGSTAPKPPPRKDASTEVLRELLEIAELTKKLDLSPETREGVQKAVKEINEILAERAKKK